MCPVYRKLSFSAIKYKMKNKMNAKRTLVSFLAIATLLFLATTVSALEITSTPLSVQIDNVAVNSATAIAGEDVTVKVTFTVFTGMTDGLDNDADGFIDVLDTTSVGNFIDESSYDSDYDASNVRVRIKLEGEEGDSTTTSAYFDVEAGKTYVKTLTIEVPEVDEDKSSEDMDFTVKVWNADLETENSLDTLRVQRESFEVEVKSVIMSNTLSAGETSPIEVVLKNTGYNDLEELYVTVSITELGVERTTYFGDLVTAAEFDSDDDEDSVTVYLEVPYSVASGIYTLGVEVADFSEIVEKQVTVANGFPEVVLKAGSNLLVLNPTNALKVYTIVYPSEELTIAVQAGSSKLVEVLFPEDEEYNFDVLVLSGNELVGTVNYTGVSEDADRMSSPIFVLTLILAVIFVVLLVVMIVLITKKPEKAEEFGESYY